MRVIATVMGEPDSNTRNSEVSSMLDYAFAQVAIKKVDGEITPTNKIELDDITLPIKVGDIVGKLYVMNENKIINEIDLTVKEDIKKCNLIELFYKYLKNVISGNISF